MLCTPELGEEDMENLEEVVGAHVRKLKTAGLGVVPKFTPCPEFFAHVLKSLSTCKWCISARPVPY